MENVETPSASRSPSLVAQFVQRWVIVVAAVLVGLWLWHSWAVFSTSSWNDIRLAPAIALKLGESIYPGLGGAPSTWMYGPLPIWLLTPAAHAGNPASALGLAGLLNLLPPLAAILLVCHLTPLPGGKTDSRRVRWIAVLLVIAIWPRAVWQFIQADNIAITVGLMGNLLLMRRRSSLTDWCAALFATAALLCKQTSIAVPIAQVLWLLATLGWRSAIAHGFRLATTGLCWVLLALTFEHPAALRLSLLTLPGGLPWVQDLGARLTDAAAALVVHLLLPAVAYLWIRRRDRAAADGLALPTLTWLIAVPPGLAALLTFGGNVNSLQGLGLWLPAGITTTVWWAAQQPLGRWAPSFAAGVAAALVGLRLAIAPAHPWGLNHARYEQAAIIEEALPGRVWFPWHPLVTLYTDGVRYADEDGVAVRALAGLPLTRDELARQLPPRFSAIALPAGTAHWSVAAELRPAQVETQQVGEWVLDVWSDSPAPPAP